MTVDYASVTREIKGLSADSREIKKGYLFAALPGTRFDGRNFMDAAVMNGATHILAPKGTQFPDNVVGIESDAPRRDFAKIAAAFYGAQPGHIVAITGTNGKTSTAEFVRQLCDIAGYKSASLGTLGLRTSMQGGEGSMTTPDPVRLHAMLADLKAAGIDHLAMEASSHGLDQSRLDGVVVKVAAYTNLSQDHLDYHADMDSYFAAKKRLFDELLGDDGVAVVNVDDVYAARLPRIDIGFGRGENADLRLASQVPVQTGQDLSVSYDGTDYQLHLPLIGLFQAYNALCAAACCIGLGMDGRDVFANLEKLQGVPGRMELVAARGDGAAAYVDYAHTPDALEKVLTALRPHVAGRLICVFGAGGNRDKGKRPKMGRVVDEHADIAIITDDNPRGEDPQQIRQEILSACSRAENIGGRGKAIAYAASILKAGDVLLVAGKGHEQGQTIGDTTHPFDDVTETRKAMEAYEK